MIVDPNLTQMRCETDGAADNASQSDVWSAGSMVKGFYIAREPHGLSSGLQRFYEQLGSALGYNWMCLLQFRGRQS